MKKLGQKGKGLFRLLIFSAATFALLAVYSASSVFADDEDEDEKPPKEFLMKNTGKENYVPFNHDKGHKDKVAKCSDCHPRVFSQKLGRTKETKGELKMEAQEKGAFCGKCHNGKDAFGVKSPDPDNKEICARCHSVIKDAAP